MKKRDSFIENEIERNKTTKRLYAIYKKADGFDMEVEDFKALEKNKELEQGQLYVIEAIDMGASHTSLYLQGVSLPLSSVGFDIFEMKNGKLVEYDIYDDKEINPYI